MEDGACGEVTTPTREGRRAAGACGPRRRGLGCQFLLQALEFGLLRAHAGGLYEVDDDLEVAALGVELTLPCAMTCAPFSRGVPRYWRWNMTQRMA